jgi:hypothetical protein
MDDGGVGKDELGVRSRSELARRVRHLEAS